MAREYPYNRTQTHDVRVRCTEEDLKLFHSWLKASGCKDMTHAVKQAVSIALLDASVERAKKTTRRP